MAETTQKNSDFINLYNKSYRLAAAVFTISKIIDESDELRTKIKKLSLDLVSMSVNLKDINFSDGRKLITDIEKNSLELMSMLDIASISGLISKMNANILKEEFQSFLTELGKFSEKFEDKETVSVQNVFNQAPHENIGYELPSNLKRLENIQSSPSAQFNDHDNNQKNNPQNGNKNGNGHRRKELRKNTILDFIRGHGSVSIKDITPHIIGCSEKTIQRELIGLINEGKIKKTGERRWSKYFVS